MLVTLDVILYLPRPGLAALMPSLLFLMRVLFLVLPPFQGDTPRGRWQQQQSRPQGPQPTEQPRTVERQRESQDWRQQEQHRPLGPQPLEQPRRRDTQVCEKWMLRNMLLFIRWVLCGLKAHPAKGRELSLDIDMCPWGPSQSVVDPPT